MRRRSMSRYTVLSETVSPRFTSSPWLRGVLKLGLAVVNLARALAG
jgi:hypothetical protein